jgi:DNA-binding XRE family transcriptional regulator
MEIDALLDAAKNGARLETDSALADRLGVTKQAVSNWRHGAKLPDAVACEKLAVLSGFPLARVLGHVGEQRAISAAEKRVWRKLATAAALMLAVGFSALPPPLTASDVCIMRSVSRLARYLSALLRKPWSVPHGSPALLAA